MLEAIRTFVIAVRTGSFSAAARQLDVSPALVGRRIAGLEEQYRTKLIERTTRSHRLTTAGEHFLERAEALLDAADDLEEAAREQADLSGRIRMSAPTTLGIKRLAPLVAAFRRDNPGVTVELSLSDRRVDLVSEGFDCALRIGDLPPSSLVARRVATYDFAICASPSWVALHGHPETPEALQGQDCILNLNMRPRNRWPFFGADGRVDVDLAGGLEIDNGEAQRAAALVGAGVVYLPVELVGDDIRDGSLIRLLADWKTMSMPVYLVHPTRRLMPARLRALLDAVATGLAQTV